MTLPLVWTALVVAVMITAMAREWAAPALVMASAMVALLLTGVIGPSEALAGFSNQAPITVAALFVLARAVEKTGALQPLVGAALRNAGGERRTLLRLLTPVTAASAFLNNTPIVAMLIGPVSSWAERNGRAVSSYLMPIAFATSLGGMVTLIGTSTNLVGSGLLEGAGYAPLGMFELTPIGLPIAVLGGLFLVLASPRLLPKREGIRGQFQAERREFTLEMQVEPGGAAADRTAQQVGLRHLEGVFLAWIRRGETVISPVSPEETLRAGDVLGFVGNVDRVMDLQRIAGLRSAEHKHFRDIEANSHAFFQAVIAPISPLVGETLKSAEFRANYQATVLAVHRSGKRIEGKLGEVALEPGDTLLVLAEHGFARKWRDRRDFLLVSQLAGTMPMSSGKGYFVLATTLAVVLLAGLGVIPILQASLAAAVLMVLGKILTPSEARGSVNMDVLVMIACSFGVAAAIERSGLAHLIATSLVDASMGLGPVAVLAAVVLVEILLTELLSNNAAVALIFPIALSAAEALGTDPRPFVIAVTVAASASFMTPMGYQTNLMVYGPGGYRFRDYLRLGTPLDLFVGMATVLMVSLVWGLH